MKNQKWNWLIIILFAGALIGSLFLADKPQNIWNALRSAKPVFIGGAILCMVGYWLFESLALYLVANRMHQKLSFSESIKTSMVGQLFNCITPFASGGQPIQAYRLKQFGIPVGKASCILLAKFIVYQVVLTIYSLILILLRFSFFVSEVSSFEYLVLLGFGVNCVVVFLLIGVGFFPKGSKKALYGLTSLLGKLHLVKDRDKMRAKIDKELDEFYTSFRQLKENLTVLLAPCLVTVLQLTIFFTVPYCICLALGVADPQYLTIISAAAFVLMISSFIPLPGGSGGAEGGFYLLFSMFFPTAGLVAVTIVLWRIMTFYLPIVVGFIFSKLKVKRRIRL
ncbi:Uncharacterised protein family (UPF0104) [uncultured Ruminococcus sp.]|uniref:Phosphatidylglycerol lysyltransferase n=1 Tax=Massiliimalia timonensis TaxID=1987501 RepID=A0A8J6PC09_9FIRM|nr:lysylphosphatidylglycerol synthase transmembrane domain-containing protein [Massiliimalia timonensis]MBC8609601.1 flippase-like domain-containing protein [Massiliimalia timonensis]MBS7176911.1 flippase-like domain-containing protein [Clostridiales bacterium]SCH35510.1 Uncharacterised protein family (UPF0104) [uncultured Ruminococcus sp.]SCH37684.1 Uncharacterised protein family (UPF0104) [uncultured Clostridium sp.]